MNTAAKIIGNHVFFFPDGANFTVPANGTAGRNSKPGAADAGWIDFGIVDSLGVNHQREEKKIFAPTPGQKRLHDVLETKRELEIKIDCEEMSAKAFELTWGTLALTAAANQQYNPLEGSVKKGWIKIQQYDQDDQLVNTVDVYCRLKVDGEVKYDDNEVKTPITLSVLHSTLNTGTLA